MKNLDAKGGTTKTHKDFLNKWEEEQANYYEYYDIDELERDYRDFLGKEPSKKLTKDDLINALIKEELKTIKSDSKYELKERIDEIREKSGAESNADEDDDYYTDHPDWQLDDYAKGGMVSVAKTKSYFIKRGEKDYAKKWEKLSKVEQERERQYVYNNSDAWLHDWKGTQPKKQNNEMLIGGIAGILLGIFL